MRIGLLGGAFDPVHNGHIALARYAIKQLNLDCVLFLPSGAPPHKDTLSSFRLRCYLLDLALREEPGCEVSDLDRDQGRTTYTYHLLNRVREQFSNDELFFLIGDDIVNELPQWYRYEDTLQLAQFVVFSRYTRNDWGNAPYLDKLMFVDMPPVPISSTIIRQRIEAGKDISDLAPPAVARWYRENDET